MTVNVAPVARRISWANGVGMLALAKAQIPLLWQMKEWWLADIITVPMYLLIIKISLGENLYDIEGMGYMTYFGYGLLICTCLLRAFESAAYAMMDVKMNGSFPSYVQSPMLAWELLAVWSATYLFYVLVLGAFLLILLSVFGLPLPHLSAGGFIVLAAFCVTVISIGHFAALLSQRWDHIVAVDTFTIMPIMMLSGVFFPPSALPDSFAPFFDYNPFFIAIDTLRQSFVTGNDVASGVIIMSLTIALWSFGLAVLSLHRGWGVKS